MTVRAQVVDVAEDVTLVGDETISDFMEDLREALGAAFNFVGCSGCGWYFRDVASDWLVLSMCGGPDEDHESCLYRVGYSRDASGAFTFSDAPEAVEADTVYNPTTAEATTTADVPAISGAMVTARAPSPAPKLRKRGATAMTKKNPMISPSPAASYPTHQAGTEASRKKKRTYVVGAATFAATGANADAEAEKTAVPAATEAAPAAKQIFEDAVELVDVRELIRTGVSPAFAKLIEGFETAAGGSKFLRVLEGRGAVGGRVNLNHRLYGLKGMAENVQALTKAIGEGAFISGEADHPESSPRILATCTKLLRVTFDEESGDVRVVFGLLPTSAGRDVSVLVDHKMRVGVSTRSLGYAVEKTMDEENPYFVRNAEHAGKPYDEIENFELQAFDLVVQPSAGTFLGESMSAEAIARAAALITQSEDTNVTNEDFKKMLTEFAAKPLAEIEAECPALVEAVRKALPAPAAPVVAPAAITEAEVRELRADNAATKSIVAELKAERDSAILRAKKQTAVDKACEGKRYGDARRAYLREHFVEVDSLALDAVEGIVTKFEQSFAPFLGAAEGEGGTRTSGDKRPTNESADADIGLNFTLTKGTKTAQ